MNNKIFLLFFLIFTSIGLVSATLSDRLMIYYNYDNYDNSLGYLIIS